MKWIAALAIAAAGCRHTGDAQQQLGGHAAASASQASPSRAATPEMKIQASLEDQLEWGTVYYAAYTRIDYPGGDLPRDRGVCTDVVIRAYRAAGFDLQKLVHEDAQSAISRYPRIGSTVKLDRSIDHRRCPNLVSYFKAHADQPADWQPGDIVFWKLAGGLDHVGIVSESAAPDGTLLVVHNIGGTRKDDSLHAWPVVGHFRWRPWDSKMPRH